MSRLGDRVRAWLDYDAAEDLRLAERSAAVDRDIARAGLTHEKVADALNTSLTHPATGATLLKPQDVDRATIAILAVIDDDDRPTGEHGDVDAIRNAVTR